MADKKKKAAAPVDEKAAKRKARMEALKNRPAEQRPNSKQIDIFTDEKTNGYVKNFGYPLKANGKHIGVLVTSVAYDSDGNVLSSNVALVPGDLTVKAKKGHGTIVAAKYKTEEQKAKKKSKKAAKEEEDED